jgi:hypothetical protein
LASNLKIENPQLRFVAKVAKIRGRKICLLNPISKRAQDAFFVQESDLE